VTASSFVPAKLCVALLVQVVYEPDKSGGFLGCLFVGAMMAL